MAKTAKSSSVVAEFSASVRVQVRKPRFEPLGSLSSLDVKRLERGNHKIEIGFLHGGCCRKLVRAIVKNGMVLGFEVEACKETHKAAPKELRAIVAKAHQKIAGGKKWKPIPVARLVSSNTALLDSLIIWGGGCVLVCCFGHCIMCCWWPRPHCFFPDIYTGPL